VAVVAGEAEPGQDRQAAVADNYITTEFALLLPDGWVAPPDALAGLATWATNQLVGQTAVAAIPLADTVGPQPLPSSSSSHANAGRGRAALTGGTSRQSADRSSAGKGDDESVSGAIQQPARWLCLHAEVDLKRWTMNVTHTTVTQFAAPTPADRSEAVAASVPTWQPAAPQQANKGSVGGGGVGGVGVGFENNRGASSGTQGGLPGDLGQDTTSQCNYASGSEVALLIRASTLRSLRWQHGRPPVQAVLIQAAARGWKVAWSTTSIHTVSTPRTQAGRSMGISAIPAAPPLYVPATWCCIGARVSFTVIACFERTHPLSGAAVHTWPRASELLLVCLALSVRLCVRSTPTLAGPCGVLWFAVSSGLRCPLSCCVLWLAVSSGLWCPLAGRLSFNARC
jgi:hypothetical protein